MIVDAQVHVWAADSPDRPWIPGQGHRTHRLIPMSHPQLLAEMASAGVDKAVLVPPSFEGDRVDVVLAAARAHPDRFAAMGRLAIEDARNGALLPGWRQQAGMFGLRFTFHISPYKQWLEDGTADWFWPAAEKAGVPLMVLPTGSLDAIYSIAERHPGLRIIIDHCALHRVGAPTGPYEFDEQETTRLLRLARLPNVAVKASALPLFSNELYPFRDIEPFIRRLFDAFGPKRMFWGSDMTRMPCSYRQCVTHFTEELRWLTGTDLQWVMGRGLCEWLGWDEAVSAMDLEAI